MELLEVLLAPMVVRPGSPVCRCRVVCVGPSGQGTETFQTVGKREKPHLSPAKKIQVLLVQGRSPLILFFWGPLQSPFTPIAWRLHQTPDALAFILAAILSVVIRAGEKALCP